MKKIIVAAAAAAAFATPAFAQEESNFGGFKAGVVLGYDSTKLEIEDEGGSKGGFLYGVTAGYDLQLGRAVLGVEAEVTDSTTRKRAADLLKAGDRAKLSAGRDLYIGARAGVAFNPTLLGYVKAGYTNARVKLNYDGVPATTSFTASDNLDGYRLGAGLEYSPKGNFFGRLEYRYSDYGKFKYQGVNTGVETSRHQVAVTAGYRF